MDVPVFVLEGPGEVCKSISKVSRFQNVSVLRLMQLSM